jgi:hypothetical protein
MKPEPEAKRGAEKSRLHDNVTTPMRKPGLEGTP